MLMQRRRMQQKSSLRLETHGQTHVFEHTVCKVFD